MRVCKTVATSARTLTAVRRASYQASPGRSHQKALADRDVDRAVDLPRLEQEGRGAGSGGQRAASRSTVPTADAESRRIGPMIIRRRPKPGVSWREEANSFVGLSSPASAKAPCRALRERHAAERASQRNPPSGAVSVTVTPSTSCVPPPRRIGRKPRFSSHSPRKRYVSGRAARDQTSGVRRPPASPGCPSLRPARRSARCPL